MCVNPKVEIVNYTRRSCTQKNGGQTKKGKQSGAGVGGGIREPPKCYPAEREKEKRGTEGALRGTLTLLPSFSSYTTFRSSFFFFFFALLLDVREGWHIKRNETGT